MNSNIKKALIIIVIPLLIIAVASCTKKTDTDREVINTTNLNQKKVENVENVEKENIVIEKGVSISDNEAIVTKGVYKNYDAGEISDIKGNIVLFFHATWCPSCKSADKNISAGAIPEGLTILKLDYDKELDLKKKYGVTTQHTFVQIDNSGNKIKKWIGSRDVSGIEEKIN